MLEYTIPLGNAIKDARTAKKLTQREVANLADIDVRTVLNIENYKGNPKIEVLFPLVRVLGIDPMTIFYPENQIENAAERDMRILISECSEKELSAMLLVCKTMLTVVRNGNDAIIKSDDAGAYTE